MSIINPNVTDVDQFKLMMDHKRSVVRISLYVGMPLVCALAIKDFIKGNPLMALLECAMLLILILFGFVTKGRIDEKSEYKIYSILFRLFNAAVGIALLYQIGFQSNFSRIEWCYIYPLLVLFASGAREGVIWVSIFYGILAFLILKFDLQGITLFQIQGLRSRFLVSFFVVCMLSIFLERGFRHAQWRLLHHLRILKESENRYRQAYEQLNTEMQERKQTEEALRESEAKFQKLFDEAPVGYHEYDTEGRITRVNRTELEMLGYASEEVLGQPVWKFIGEVEPSRHAVLAKLAGTTPPGHSFERSYRRKNGTEFPVIISDRPLRDREGKIIGIRSTIQDITDRKQAEEILKEHQEVIEGSQDMIAVVDQNYNYLLANNAFLKYRGVDREQVIGRSISEVLGNDVFEKVIKKNLDTCFQGKVVQHEMKYTYPVLDERDLWVSYFPIKGPQGVNRVASVIRDITEQKRAEKKVKESEERFRQLAENIREVFYIYEPDIRQLSYVSSAYMEIWGRTSQSLYEEPRSFLDTIHPEDKDRVIRSLERKSRGEVEEVYRIVRRDGSIRWIKERSFPIYDDSGKAYRIVGIAADITDLKLGEEKMKYLSSHDPLTGLYNRIYFEEEMSRIEKSRYGTVAIVSCDVDGLKLVNDTLGHNQGDNLLIAAAGVIKESFREGDLVARIGGDEFSAILPNTTESALENTCRRIQKAVESYNAIHPELPLSISVGFAVSNRIYGNLKDVFKEADNNMYRKKLSRTQSVRSTIIKTLTNTLKARNFTTEKHVIRLEKLLISLAALIGLSESTKSDLSLLAKFHDIGKVGISDSILFKKGPLTSEGWAEMRRHCEIGYRIALSASDLVPIADWILKHHEWWDGTGYPLGIKGEEIPMECRLLAIAEAYEALTSVRPYRNALSHAEAVAELMSHSRTHFDPKLLEKFLQIVETHPPESLMGS